MVEEKDLKLSSKITEQIDSLEKNRQSNIETFKKEESDTIEAVLLLKEYHTVLANKFSYCSGYSSFLVNILKEITTSFPKANNVVLIKSFRIYFKFLPKDLKLISYLLLVLFQIICTSICLIVLNTPVGYCLIFCLSLLFQEELELKLTDSWYSYIKKLYTDQVFK